MRNGEYELVVAPAEYPGKKYRGKYVYEHQLVWWQNTGTTVPEGYLIHHLNHRKRDNRFANLELQSRASHGSLHGAQQSQKGPPVMVTCGWCKSGFQLTARVYDIRMRQTRSGHLFCCKSHQVRWQQAQRRAKRLGPDTMTDHNWKAKALKERERAQRLKATLDAARAVLADFDESPEPRSTQHALDTLRTILAER